jgi:predicted outer membrane repeat protein
VDNYTDGSNGLPSVVSPIVINGNGATIQRSLTSGTPAFRIFHVSNIGMLTLNNLTLVNGLAHTATTGETAHNAGGGIYNNNRISLYGVVIDGNHAKLGGGIYNTAANGMTINTSTFQNNGADVENVAGERGGGIYSLSSVTITQSTFFNNTATETGGAIENGPGGRLAISNSTFSGNSSVILGGSAIFNSGEITVMAYTTITNNMGGAPGAALLSGPDTIEIRNSIIANNSGGDCSYPATSSIRWENLDSDGTCNGFTITDAPALDPLADNGGPTLTHALTPSSPAVDAAAGDCVSVDQRNTTRPQNSACDLGAFEYSGTVPTPEPTVIPSSVMGFVFIDANGNGIRDASELSNGVTGANLTLMSGPCPGVTLIRATSSNSSDGLYGFGMLMPGTYCILTDPLQQTLVPVSQEITVGNDENLVDVNFYLPNPAPQQPPTCSRDLGSEACQEAGGTMSTSPTTAPFCICP